MNVYDAFMGFGVLAGVFASIGVFLVWLICWIVSISEGNQKNIPGAGWLGFLLGPMGLLIVLLMSHREDPSETRICPICAERIKAQAVVCRHCGRDLPKTSVIEFTISRESSLHKGEYEADRHEHGDWSVGEKKNGRHRVTVNSKRAYHFLLESARTSGNEKLETGLAELGLKSSLAS